MYRRSDTPVPRTLTAYRKLSRKIGDNKFSVENYEAYEAPLI